ncbi:MAG: hypothetical protein Q9181_005915 [Wetmoreana brouardii]
MDSADSESPLHTVPSLSWIKQTAATRSKAIFADRDALLGILERYEEKLRIRCAKKTSEQRRKVLLKVYPDMLAMRRPDFQAFRREPLERPRTGTRFRDSFLLPSINLEDRRKQRALLLLLHARGRHDPDIFANSDLDSVRLGDAWGAFGKVSLPGYIMLLVGQKSASTYGGLIARKEDIDAPKMLESGIGTEPRRGLLIMEIQQRKLDFLRKCAELLLQDLPLDDTAVHRQPFLPDLHVCLRRGHSDASRCTSLNMEISEAPFRVPDRFDIGRLRSFITAKRDEAEDHIWLLREDPAYFKNAVLEWSEHRGERILGVNGRTHPALGSTTFWERVLGPVVLNAYLDFLSWDQLRKLVDQLEGLREQNTVPISSTNVVAGDFERTLCHFSYTLHQVLPRVLMNLTMGIPSSPPLRKHFVRDKDKYDDSGEITVSPKTYPNNVAKTDYSLWLLTRLMNHDPVTLWLLDTLLDEIERKLRSDKTFRERVSPWVARVVSDLSLLGEIRRQIGLLRPGPATIEVISREEQHKEFARRMELFDCICRALVLLPNFSEIGTPLAKFNYPSDKRLSAKSTKSLQEAERNLDAFWGEIDRQFSNDESGNLHDILTEVLPPRKISRTPDWKDTDEKITIRLKDVDDLTVQAAVVELEMRTQKTINHEGPLLRSQKIKTRGEASESAHPSELGSELPIEEPESLSPKFTVSKRGFKVFSTLFHTPNGEDPPGEVPLSEFLSAMASVGFSVRKLDGSAWVFEPLTDVFRRSIIFHEPHPTNKIPFQTARRYGRRLERAYGWTGASFSRT